MVNKISNPANVYQQIAKTSLSTMKTAEVPANGQILQDFGKVLGDFIGDVNTSKVTSEDMQNRYVKGENIDVNEVLIASSQTNVKMNFLVATRDKAVDIYNTLFNMSI